MSFEGIGPVCRRTHAADPINLLRIIVCRIFSARLCVSSRCLNRRMVDSSGRRSNSFSWVNPRHSGVSKKASSIAGSDKVNHCCSANGYAASTSTKRGPASLAFGVIGGNEFDQRSPRHHLIHLVQEHFAYGFSSR